MEVPVAAGGSKSAPFPSFIGEEDVGKAAVVALIVKAAFPDSPASTDETDSTARTDSIEEYGTSTFRRFKGIRCFRAGKVAEEIVCLGF